MNQRAIYRQRDLKRKLAFQLKIATWVLTGAVLLLVAVMREVRLEIPDWIDLGFLPATHAIINTLVSICLIGAILTIKRGQVVAHRNFIFAAVVLSVLFLLGYVAYHFTTNEIRYGDTNLDGEVDAAEKLAVGNMRIFYLVLLLTHIVAAAVSLPAILITLSTAITNQFSKHLKLARWVFPIWLFVAVSGPICYLLLRPYYP